MFVERGLSAKRKWVYFLLAFLMFITFFSGSETDQLTKMVDELGELVTFFSLLFPFLFFFFGIILISKFAHQINLKDFTTSRKSIRYSRIFFSFGLWSLLSVAFFILDYYLFPDDYIWNFNAEKFFPLLIISFCLIPFQAGFEEYFFRSYLMQGAINVVKKRWFALLFSSVFFGLAHIANPEIQKLGYGILTFYIFSGFILGVITILDEGIELALGFHIANNIMAALLVSADWMVFQVPSLFKQTSEPELNIWLIANYIVPYSIMFFILLKKYQWKNIKENLFDK